MVDVSIRIRRAIRLKDLTLLKRIIKNNLKSLQNPDFTDNGNTSLHLAAQLGLLDIAEFLVDAGHEDGGISKNGNWDTPLLVAVETSEPVATLLATRFPWCIPWKNKQGADALIITSRTPHTALLTHLLTLSPTPTSPLAAIDTSGNTPLHYASAYGQLKSIRTLLEHGADASARNAWSWTPVNYSASVQAEVYFKGLVNAAEREREGMREGMTTVTGARSRGGSGPKSGGGMVRMVSAEEGEEFERMRKSGESGRVRAGSGG